MENGHEGKLVEKMSAMGLNDASSSSNDYNNNNDSLFQVIKAVEAAEVTIKQQVEENAQLRTELQKKILELEKYKLDGPMTQGSHSGDTWNKRVNGPYEAHYPITSTDNQEVKINRLGVNSVFRASGPLVLRHDLQLNSEDATMQSHLDSNTNNSNIIGMMKERRGSQTATDNAGVSQFSSPSAPSFSPGRYQMEAECDSRLNLSRHGFMQMAVVNNSGSHLKEDFIVKIREHEEEIMQLRKHLADYSVKEAQIQNEKYVLEKRIAYMRLAFDQQQSDLVDAASKALSYRQDIIEENIRLTYELQAAQQERSTFVSSLLPLLAEYALQPPVPDAQSIVSNVKVLFRHLHEKLIHTESKLKESQYQLAPWRSDVNHNIPPLSPSHPIGAALTTSSKNGLELVPQPPYSLGNTPVTSSAQSATDWDIANHHQSGLDGAVARNLESDDMGKFSPLASRNSSGQDITGVTPMPFYHGDENTNKQVLFNVHVSNSEVDDPDEGQQNERDASTNWGPGPYTNNLDDPSTSYSAYLPPVLEEPSSSFSEAADDDPLPAVEGLQISGDAYPGRELQANGYSINGTTSCNFEWVRYSEDGSFTYIDGAKQPTYLITADDVDSYLAIQVQPLDDRKRKGELVKVFANDHRKITCDPEMQNHIEKTLYSGHASYKVSVSTGFLDIWEPATLTIKKEGYSIKRSGPSSDALTEKLSPTTSVTILYGQPTIFSIIDPSGLEHVLRAESSDSSSSRDTIVLTLRLFIIRAGERRKVRKRGLFFNK